jgi:ornithine racemase
MAAIRLTIDLSMIAHNARKAVEICRQNGVEVMGVTKGVCGLPSIARAMLTGGIQTLGDSRLDNIIRLRAEGIHAPIVLLRSPAPSEVAQCVALANASMNADLTVLRALSEEAERVGKSHGVIVMVDLETGREGFAAEELPSACREISEMKGLRLHGLGAYFVYGSNDELYVAAQQRLVALAREIEARYGIVLPVISGGSTNVFHSLTLHGKHVTGINQLRIGTAILLGISSSIGPHCIEGFHHDTFMLDAELVEVKRREKLLGILSLGHQDTDPEFLFPTSPGVTVVDASCDHTIVDLTGAAHERHVGDRISFRLGYFAMSRSMASPYVKIECREA